MTCADKLRDLHARLTQGEWTLDPESGEFYAASMFGEGPILMVDDDDCLAIAAVRNALPEIAAVIEAAERVWDPKQSDGCHCRYDVPDKITDPLLIKVECEPCAAYRLLADALAALSARLDGAT